MMKTKLLMALFAILALAFIVDAVSFTSIPNQTFILNVDTQKVIDLSQFASNDTTSYTHNCNASQLNVTLVGAGHKTNFTYSNAVGFLGNTTCTITASNATNSTNQIVNFEVRNPIKSISVPSKISLNSNNKRGVNATSSFTVQNTGDTDLNNILVNSTSDPKYKITFSLNSTTNFTSALAINLSKAETKTVYILGFIPTDTNIGTDIDIGDISLKSSDINTTISSFVINTELKLNIEKVKVEYTDIDGDLQSKTIETQDQTINDINPGTDINFEITVDNDFTSGDDIEIEDILVELSIDSIDDGSDVEEEATEFDLEADKDEKVTIGTKIPQEAERSEYKVTVTAKGKEKETKALHTDTFIFNINVNRRQHDVTIDKVILADQILSCKKETNLYVDISNQGRDEEDEVAIKVENTQLGIVEIQKDIELTNDYIDEDSKYSTIFPIKLRDSVTTGEYTLRVTALFSDDITDDIKDVKLKVSECSQDTTKTETKKEDKKEETKVENKSKDEKIEVKLPPPPNVEPVQEPPRAVILDEEVEETTESDIKNSGVYTALVVLGGIVLLLGAVFAGLIMNRELK